MLAAVLAFKAFVPMLAALSAEMQGKAVADVCAVYGVRLGPAVDAAPPMHALHHMHGAAHASMGAAAATPPDHAPHEHAEHARDHCALSGLTVGVLFAPTPWALVEWQAASAMATGFADVLAPSRDASARWLTLRVHAPPARG